MRFLYWVLLAMGCEDANLPLYWETDGPTITGHTPLRTDSLLGGELISIHGHGLATTRTVVVGGRNATIIRATENTVEIELPPGTPGGGMVDITVVTDSGQSTMEECFEYASPGADLWANEVASISLYQVHCPIELWTLDNRNEWAELWWCGFEAGYTEAYGFDGAAPQPGFAGDLMGFAGINGLPPLGESRVVNPGERRTPPPPLVYGVHPDDESFQFVVDRDFERDFDILEQQLELIDDTYYWASSIYETRPTAWLYGPDECYDEALDILDFDSGELLLADDPSGATGIQFGVELTEAYNVNRPNAPVHLGWDLYRYDVLTGTAMIESEGDRVIGGKSGVTLRYDGWSGYFYADTIGGALQRSDLPWDTTYRVRHTRLDDVHELGTIHGVERLELLSPALMGGNLQVDGEDPDPAVHNIGFLQGSLGLDGSMVIEWVPAENADEGTFISIELVFYDANLDDPMWMTEIGRIVMQGDDQTGVAVIPVDQLLSLPQAPNLVDRNTDLIGVWAELSIARHQLRVLPLEDGDLVIDFVDVVNAPITIYHPE